jgi:hypothetical protein
MGVMFCAIGALQAQVSLTGTSYTETFDGIGTGYPTGWSVKLHATATALGTDTVLTTTPIKWTSTTKGVSNYASADGLAATDTLPATQNAATDRALGVRQTSSLGDPGFAFTVQIANTTDMNTFGLAFKLQSLDASSPRTTIWKVQYATGAAPTTFTDLTTTPATITTGGSTWSNTNVTASFGALLDNQSGPVWIRIVALTASTGSGNRPTSAIDDFTLTWTNGAATTVAAPVFTPNSGTYYGAVNVSIASSTPGSEVRYTTDGTTPDGTSTLYTSPINVSTQTTINAIGIKTGLTNSTVSTATYTIVTPVACANIAELLTKTADNSTVYGLTNEAVLTYKQAYKNQKWIQDATAAINIYDVDGKITTNYNIGDGIIGLAGKLTNYHGLLEFVPIQDAGAAHSTGNVITPTVVNLSDLLAADTLTLYAHQSKLIKLENISFTDANGTTKFAVGKKYKMTQNATSDTTFFCNFYDANYAATATAMVIPTGTGEVVGIAVLDRGNYYITARDNIDISLINAVPKFEENRINVYPNPSKNNVYVSLDGTYDVTVMSILGQRVYSQNNASGTIKIDCSSLGKGIFFVQARNADNKTITKRVVVE